MNERIKLPAQEWLGYDPERGNIHGYTFDQMRDFARSIIMECAELVDADGDAVMALRMMTHFGVEL